MLNLGSAPGNLATFDDLLHSSYAAAAGVGGPVSPALLFTTAFGGATPNSLASAHPVGTLETGGTLSGVLSSGPLTYQDLQAASYTQCDPNAIIKVGPCAPGGGVTIGGGGSGGGGDCATSCQNEGGVLWCAGWPFNSAVCKSTGVKILLGGIALIILAAGVFGLVLPQAEKVAPVIAKAAG